MHAHIIHVYMYCYYREKWIQLYLHQSQTHSIAFWGRGTLIRYFYLSMFSMPNWTSWCGEGNRKVRGSPPLTLPPHHPGLHRFCYLPPAKQKQIHWAQLQAWVLRSKMLHGSHWNLQGTHPKTQTLLPKITQWLSHEGATQSHSQVRWVCLGIQKREVLMKEQWKE